jgi:hypothetical protein
VNGNAVSAEATVPRVIGSTCHHPHRLNYFYLKAMATIKQQVLHFFELKWVQVCLMVLIIISSAAIAVEFFYPQISETHQGVFQLIEYVVLPIFTIEFLLRFWAAPDRFVFLRKPFNIIDLLAIVPSYIELVLAVTPAASALRALRLLRLMRLSRLLRAFKLFRYKAFTRSVIQYEDTILQSITPVIVGFVVMKLLILLLAYKGWWFAHADLSELFAIIGFALGIILSQKIGTTYSKFTQIEEMTIQLSGTLHTLELLAPGPEYKQWAHCFIQALLNPTVEHRIQLQQVNQCIWQTIRTLEAQPSELTILYKDFLCDSQFCLNKAERLTPAAYDSLLHQATIVYLLLITLFVPGYTGLISTFIATYILYGMYRVTQDLDTIVGSEYKLINIDLTELRLIADQHI